LNRIINTTKPDFTANSFHNMRKSMGSAYQNRKLTPHSLMNVHIAKSGSSNGYS